MNSGAPWLDRIAHDLRGPLMPLQTATYLLRSGQVDVERQAELYAVIERQTRQLAGMIDEFDDWTRASQQRLLGARERCDPALLLDYARSGGGDAAGIANVEDHADGAEVDGDPVRLTQLFRSLIEYAAARAGAAPDISLQVAGDRLVVDVLAAGAAPDAPQLALLFEQPQPEPFDSGLGLRLLVARAIAEAHAGTVAAQEADGRLRLRCELPLAAD